MEPKHQDSEVSGQNVIEQLEYEISRKDLERISSAKLVEMRLGNSPPRKLKPELLQRFSKFLQLLDSK